MKTIGILIYFGLTACSVYHGMYKKEYAEACFELLIAYGMRDYLKDQD